MTSRDEASLRAGGAVIAAEALAALTAEDRAAVQSWADAAWEDRPQTAAEAAALSRQATARADAEARWPEAAVLAAAEAAEAAGARAAEEACRARETAGRATAIDAGLIVVSTTSDGYWGTQRHETWRSWRVQAEAEAAMRMAPSVKTAVAAIIAIAAREAGLATIEGAVTAAGTAWRIHCYAGLPPETAAAATAIREDAGRRWPALAESNLYLGRTPARASYISGLAALCLEAEEAIAAYIALVGAPASTTPDWREAAREAAWDEAEAEVADDDARIRLEARRENG